MELPTATEIDPYDNPQDGAWAVEQFLGKSLREAEELFCDVKYNLPYFGSLCFLGPKAFCYYIPAAFAPFRFDHQYGYPIKWLCYVIEHHLTKHRDEIEASFPILREGLQYFLEHWSRWSDIDVDTGPDEEPLRDQIVRLLGEVA